jgi:amidase
MPAREAGPEEMAADAQRLGCGGMATFITQLGTAGTGDRLAVKDLIDMAGLPTTAGCRAVADGAAPATQDAACMAGARAAERDGLVRIVGKANLHELAFGTSGINHAFGTPVNPLDARLVPGGSSSGSAVAVGADEADIAFGSDTGGSVRIPSACCGTAGLKTTHGRVSLDGVWPLATSLDTIGPMARDVAGVVKGMQLLEPGFEVARSAPSVVGRFRHPDVHPEIDLAVDRALAGVGCKVQDVELSGWDGAFGAGGGIILGEAWETLNHLLERRHRLGEDVTQRIELGGSVGPEARASAEAGRASWRAELEGAFSSFELIALPTMPVFPPPPDEVDDLRLTALTMPVNVAGLPALVLPVPAGRLPASIQLLGPAGAEERLLAFGAVLEQAVAA